MPATPSSIPAASPHMKKSIHPPEVRIPVTVKLPVGGVAGMLATSLIFPLDTVKTLLQDNKGTGAYSGPIDCAKKNFTKRGLSGFYKGLPWNLMLVFPEKGIKLGMNDFLREEFTRRNGNGKITVFQQILSGAGAGFTQTIVTQPMEIIKLRMQIAAKEGGASAQKSAIDHARELGLKGVYRYTSATILRDVPFSVVFFPLYATLKEKLADKEGNNSIPSLLFSGTLAGAVGAGIATPLDVIKTRLQRPGGSKQYSSIMDCWNKSVQEGGVMSLFRGAGPRMVVQAPLFGIALLAFEALKAYYANLE